MEQSWKSILTTALLVVGMPLMAAAASSAPEGVPSLESPASAMAPIVRRPSAEGPKDMRKGPAVHRSRIRVSPAVAEAMRKETKATLRKGFRLLGKTDAQAAGAFRGGKENYSADGQTLLGRVYNVPVFGEMRQAATIYDRDGKVENVHVAGMGRRCPYGPPLPRIRLAGPGIAEPAGPARRHSGESGLATGPRSLAAGGRHPDGGGAAPEIVRYVYRDGRYEAVPAGDIAGVRGRAILCGWSGPRRLQP